MKFECGDLERALSMSELMPEAKEHLKHCALCRREYRLWTDLSATAKQLHVHWETPELWPAIHERIASELRAEGSKSRTRDWKLLALAATVILALGMLGWRLYLAGVGAGTNPTAQQGTAQQDFLTEQALKDVEKTEAAYRQSIDNLSRLAEPKLTHPTTAVTVNYREKLLSLDSAIAETRANLDHNRFNVHLQMELADLYREKQQTLKEFLTRDRKN